MSDTTSCHHCDRDRDGHSYLLLYGDWDPDRDGFSRAPVAEGFCRDCWKEDFQRTVGAHWEVSDVEQLWDVLEAADGALVADLVYLFVGGRPFVRVVDGEPQAIAASTRANREEETLRVVPEFIDVDRDWLQDVFNAERNLPDDDHPTIAIIRPVEETPFGDVRERGGQSHKIEEWMQP